MAKVLGSSILNQKKSLNYLYTAGDNEHALADNNSSAAIYSFSQQVGASSDWADVSVMYDHSLGLKTDGTLWSWGYNSTGQLGFNDTVSRSSPVQIGTDTNWSKIFAAFNTSYAIKTDGTLWAWGNNSFGKYGNNTTISRSSPVQIGADTNWADIVIDSGSTVKAIKTNGTLWAWGISSGYLGDETPTTIPTILSSENWSKISIWSSFSLAIKSNGSLWAWGNNALGQLGLNDTISRSSPVQIGLLTNWSDIVTSNSCLALKTDGTLWAWGFNASGQLGQNDVINKSSPVQIGVDTNWNKIAASSASNYAIKIDNTLWAWGANNSGQLAQGDAVNRSVPTQVGLLTNWSSISASSSHFLSIKTDGTLWACGANDSGQLGQNNIIYRSSPVQVGLLTDWASISAGTAYVLAIKTDGSLWAWGANGIGQLGNGNILNFSSPIQIGLLANWSLVTTGIGSTSLALKNDGTLWGWGNNSTFQLGLGDYESRSSPVQIGSSNTWQNISAGIYGCLGTNQNAGNNNLYIWGGNNNGSLGTGASSPNRSSPIQIGSDTDWSKVSAGDQVTLLRKTDGTLWTFGANIAQLGINQTAIGFNYPIKIGNNTNWDKISAGFNSSFSVKTDGTLWGWGNNSFGQLGTNNIFTRSSPVQIGSETDWKNVFSRNGYALAIRGLDSNKQLFGFGRLSFVNIDIINRSSPILINSSGNWSVLTGANNSGSIFSPEISSSNYCLGIDSGKLYCTGVSMRGGLGANIILNYKNFNYSGFKQGVNNFSYFTHILLIDNSNRLWCWGSNTSGELGLSNLIPASSPIQVGNDVNWKMVAAAQNSSAVIKIDGTLWTWGNNDLGQLGSGNTISRSSPVQVGLLNNWDKIYPGFASFLAIKTDGTLWAWGANIYGILGSGDTASRSSPIQIGLLNDWSKISPSISRNANENHVLAIKTDGSLWAWGLNSLGQLGLNDIVSRSSPVQVGLSTDWNFISISSFGTDPSSYAIKTNGTLWAWGSNSFGQLGQNNLINRSSPIQVGIESDWKYVIGGQSSWVMAIKNNNTLYAWGKNIDFQLGDGTKINRSTPALISSLKNWILPNNCAGRNMIVFK